MVLSGHNTFHEHFNEVMMCRTIVYILYDEEDDVTDFRSTYT